MSSLSSISGTKLSQHTHTSSPTGTKLSPHTHTSSPTGTKLSQHAKNCPFQPVLPEQGELCTAPSTKPGTKLSQHAQKGPFQPVLHEQGELCPARTTTTPSRENFVPHPAPNPVQNSPNTPPPAAQPGSSPVEWCNRFVSFGVGYALSWSGGSSCWVGWGVSRDLVRTSRLR